ncbi:hypothetical protein FRC09_005467 [Ceratobasidium sp. 395]|nr:hypothetical protein FRC09_005467 [Ceratobasidium sp. 395]
MSTIVIEDDKVLNILVEGDNPKDSMTIKVSQKETFYTLAETIQSLYREIEGVDIFDLELFKFDQPDDALKSIRFSDEMRLSNRRDVSSVWPTASSINRKWVHIVVRCQTQTKFIQSLASQNPSRAAEATKFRQQQATSDYIRNGRPATRTGLPVVIYHPVFGQFLSNLQSTDPIPPTTYFQTVEYLTISQKIYETESREPSNESGQSEQQSDARYQASRGVLASLLGGFLSKSSVQGTQPDGLVLGNNGACLIIVEMKDEIGSRESDPLIQAAQSYSRYWSSSHGLAEFYHDVPIPRDNLSRFFPYVTHYTDASGRLVEFAYLKSLSETYPAGDTPVFLAETQNLDPPKQIVVKFVQTYNAEAHELLAKHGLSPALLYDGNAHPQDQPGPDHAMVVMEFLHGTDLLKFKDPLPRRIVTDIQKALEHLHEHDFVFGDLRNPNVMIVKDSHGAVTGAQLIDFDWCGRHQVGRYPFSMNPDVDWAEGVGPGALMYKSHDIDMLEKLKLSVVVW